MPTKSHNSHRRQQGTGSWLSRMRICVSVDLASVIEEDLSHFVGPDGAVWRKSAGKETGFAKARCWQGGNSLELLFAIAAALDF